MRPLSTCGGFLETLEEYRTLAQWWADPPVVRACKRAGLKPRYVSLDPKEDVVSFIRSKNIYRRDLKASQKAMLWALSEPEPEKGGCGNRVFKGTPVLGSHCAARSARAG